MCLVNDVTLLLKDRADRIFVRVAVEADLVICVADGGAVNGKVSR
jgi:hypothetical protein